MAQRYRLKLTSLKFISPVDAPAQETALAVLTKRTAGAIKDAAPQITANARVVKTSEALGLVFCWAFTTKAAGADYYDLHGDNVVEDDLIKVAAEFMENGGLTDEMHDRDPDGKVVFCMPLTAEVAKAFGVKTETEGLMIALRPSPEVFAKYVSGEYVGVSIDGTGLRETVKSSKVAKHALYTDEADGHQHQICVYDDGSFYVQHATMAGAEYSHSHGIVRGEDGTLEILADSGHKHQLAAGQPSVIIVSPDAVVVVQANAPRAPAAKSTRMSAVSQPALTSPEPNMKTAEQLTAEIADLMKRFDRSDRIVKLSPDQRAHFDGLTGEAAEEFLAKSATDRTAIVKAAADANTVEYTCLDGTEIRKSHGAMALKFAKQADEALKVATVEKSKREWSEVVKRASGIMGHLAGSDDDHGRLLQSIERETDATKRDAMIATLKAADSLMVAAGKAKGVNPGTDPEAGTGNGLTEWDAAVTTYAEKAGIKDHGVATDKFLGTPEGRVAKRAYDKASAEYRRLHE